MAVMTAPSEKPSLSSDYAWTCSPLLASAPMRLIALAPLAVAVSRAGGIGFIAAGTEINALRNELRKASTMLEASPIKGVQTGVLPIGIGFINWGVDLTAVLEALDGIVPAAVWFFAPKRNSDLVEWTNEIRDRSSGKTKIWIQIGNVSDALEVTKLCHPDVLVVQGTDAGGHGLAQGSGIISLLPEVVDALQEVGLNNISLVAAGGIVEGRGTAACLALGADGVALGTRFLASHEANIATGYQDAVLGAKDGSANTVRTDIYDQLRGTTGWPTRFNGRAIVNQSFLDAQQGMPADENKRLYDKALQEGVQGWAHRLTAYAGTAVGLVKKVKPAHEIIEEIRQDAIETLSRFSRPFSKL